MRILSLGRWDEGYLDEYCDPDFVRIQVIAVKNLQSITGMYFVRRRSWRLLWNYFGTIGPNAVLQKIRSRGFERRRNEKYVSVGIGRIITSERSNSGQEVGTVAFVAPAHPACFERVVLPPNLVTSHEAVVKMPRQRIAYLPPDAARKDGWWARIAGWSPSSKALIASPITLMREATQELDGTDWSGARLLETEDPKIQDRRVSRRSIRKPTGTLVGFGNYARTAILPNVHSHVSIQRIHEIDPTAIPSRDIARTWDTSPRIRDDDDSDAVFVAGFHHTHAPIAIDALNRGKFAVVEKPIAVDSIQLASLSDQVTRTPKLFACFHKRYSPFNVLATKDLGVELGDPISYHCIVFEVPLPALHWYRWPSSRSRIISNGCHWIDHFLFLNDFAEPCRYEVFLASDATINCSVELSNGALFTMVLTDNGSDRTGVQDYTELRANGTTVRLANGTRFESENGNRIIRRDRVNPLTSYKLMYRQIGQGIKSQSGADEPRTIITSSALCIALEERYQECLRRSSSLQ